MSSREASRKSQKLFPLVKMAVKLEVVPIHLNSRSLILKIQRYDSMPYQMMEI